MLSVNEIGDTIHRAGPVERDHGHDILDTRRLELFDVLGHLRTLKLEDTGCLAARQQVERLLTPGVLHLVSYRVEWHLLQNHFFPACLFDILERIIKNGQVGETQEVEFDQSEFLEMRLLILCDTPLAGVFGIA